MTRETKTVSNTKELQRDTKQSEEMPNSYKETHLQRFSLPFLDSLSPRDQ